MYSPSELMTAARNECHILAHQRTLPIDDLFDQARRLFQTPTETSILEIALTGILDHNTDPSPIEDKFAEFLYFYQGHQFVERRQYNKLTRLQMEHECFCRLLLTREQLPAASDFTLRLILRADQEMTRATDNSWVRRSTPPPSPSDSGYYSE